MLRRATAIVLAVLTGTGLSVVLASPALADVVCTPAGDRCYVVAGTPGSGGGNTGGGGNSGGGGGAVVCKDPRGNVIECHDSRGWYNPVDHCFWKQTDPQPPAIDAVWEGHQPTDGSVYSYTCPWTGGSWMGGSGFRFWATPPPGYGGLPSPEVLAAQAIEQLPLKGAQIQTAPDASGAGLVTLNTWMWTPVTAETWGPQTATASVPGLAVTATARAQQIEWRMGDGNSVVCTTPGTPYSAAYGGQSSPDCGYRYQRSSRSQPDGRFTVTAVTTWHVTWTGGGQTGALDVTRQSTSTIRIDELQVVTR